MFGKFFRDLREISENVLIIVEGKRDKIVLERLGIKNVYTIYELYKINFRKYREAIVLTDNDKKGRRLYKRIKEILEAEDLIVRDNYRRIFYKIIKTRSVEYLNSRIDKIKYIIDYDPLILNGDIFYRDKIMDF